ncbi:unnamed protein product [marine sediment metagenome]|uniref:Uncharacterized protein n=1 Tax=marine sediment metagenome TaxID=412755 RepID=X1JSV4_9ZZZZ
MGVTATDTSQYEKAMAVLPHIEAMVKYISFEPLLSNIEIYDGDLAFLKWLILGAMTGTRWDLVGKRNNLADQYPALTPMPYGKIWTLQPKLEWVLEIVEAADKAKIPVFLKNNLVPMIADSLNSDKVKLYDEGIWLRQEMPDLERR